jgi:hypothetical protein
LVDNLDKNYINVRELRRGNYKRTIQRNWQQRRRKTKQKHTNYLLNYYVIMSIYIYKVDQLYRKSLLF